MLQVFAWSSEYLKISIGFPAERTSRFREHLCSILLSIMDKSKSTGNAFPQRPSMMYSGAAAAAATGGGGFSLMPSQKSLKGIVAGKKNKETAPCLAI